MCLLSYPSYSTSSTSCNTEDSTPEKKPLSNIHPPQLSPRGGPPTKGGCLVRVDLAVGALLQLRLAPWTLEHPEWPQDLQGEDSRQSDPTSLSACHVLITKVKRRNTKINYTPWPAVAHNLGCYKKSYNVLSAYNVSGTMLSMDCLISS